MKQRTITGTLMWRTALCMAAFWLLSMLLTTWLFAGANSEAYSLAEAAPVTAAGFLAAAKQLTMVYVLWFILCQLLGTLIWKSFDNSLVRPLRQLGSALKADPLTISEAENEMKLPYGEVHAVLAGYRLRDRLRQAEQSAARTLSDAPARLSDAILRTESKLTWMQTVENELTADGFAEATDAALDEALLALFQDAAPCFAENCTVTVRTRVLSGFFLLELEGPRNRRLSKDELELLWDGFNRPSVSGAYPGGKVRKALWEIPGGFTGAELSGSGLIFRLGLPVCTAADLTRRSDGRFRTPVTSGEKAPDLSFGGEERQPDHPRRKLERILILTLIVLAVLAFIVLTIWMKRRSFRRWNY